MENNKELGFNEAAVVIKEAIIRSRYQAAKLINRELLSLYYAVGKYVSDNSRGAWGKGAIKQLSDSLQRELPGLRGFSESSIRKMRLFYEGWEVVFLNHPLTTDDLTKTKNELNHPLVTDEIESINKAKKILNLRLLTQHVIEYQKYDFNADDFFKVSFTHHTEILAYEKSLDGRLFYISQCATNFWSVETLKSNLRGDTYSKLGNMPNNFQNTISEAEQAKKAIRAFKEEYLLDYINIEDVDDPDDIDERIFTRGIISDVKKLILSFGSNFCLVGNHYRLIVDEDEFFVDLLFFNRELHCLVAVELKRGGFKPAYIGQLNFYLSALDKYVKREEEEPSIGIILCKSAKKSIVELAVRDFTKPIGVATYRTKEDMPEKLRNALPDLEDMRKLLDNAPDEDEDDAEVDE